MIIWYHTIAVCRLLYQHSQRLTASYQQPDANRQRGHVNRLRRSPNLILVIVLLFALVLRLTGVNWDDYARLHPDERFLTTIASRIGVARNLTDEARARCPDDTMLYDYFNTSCSILNPNNVNPGSFAYGTLPVFIVRGVADLLAKVNPWSWERPELWSSYDAVHLVGRMVNAQIGRAHV